MASGMSLTLSSNFVFEFDGVTIGNFTSFGGLEVKAEVVSKAVTEKGKQRTVKTMGNPSFENITLERTYDPKSSLFTWTYEKIQKFNPEADIKTGSVYTMDSAGTETSRWDFEGFPCGYKSPEFGADKEEVITETVTIAIVYLKKTT